MPASRRRAAAGLLAAVGLLALGACSAADALHPGGGTSSAPPAATATPTSSASPAASIPAQTEGAPSSTPSTAPVAPYAHSRPGDLSREAARARSLVYVPDQRASYLQVIDPRRYRVVETQRVASSPEHVVPSHDLRRLWVNSDTGDTLTPIDPRTGRVGRPMHVSDPYNLYFSPDGREALVMAERLRRIDVRDPRTMRLRRSLHVPCSGLNHADVTADLRLMVASCEFSGKLVVTDADAHRVVKVIDLNHLRTAGATTTRMGPAAMRDRGVTAMPQDVRLDPSGQAFLVADMLRNGIWVVDTKTLRVVRFVRTGRGAHGVYPSRDGTQVYVSNRDAGTVSVLAAGTQRRLARWHIPGGGSPDMGGVTADGRELWLSGRYDSVVYVFSTATGKVTHTIRVRPGPHGLLVWPQPGRYSLGHTGNMR